MAHFEVSVSQLLHGAYAIGTISDCFHGRYTARSIISVSTVSGNAFAHASRQFSREQTDFTISGKPTSSQTSRCDCACAAHARVLIAANQIHFNRHAASLLISVKFLINL